MNFTKLMLVFTLAVIITSCSTTYRIPDAIQREQQRHINTPAEYSDPPIQLDPIEQIPTDAPKRSFLFVKSATRNNWGYQYLEIDKIPNLIEKLGLKPERKVHVFIFDTSGKYEHNLLKDIQGEGKSFTGEDLLGANGHSPHVAGTIGADDAQGNLGVATIVRDAGLLTIYPYKVLSNAGSGSYTQVTAGTKYANNLAKSIHAANQIAEFILARGEFVIYNYSLGGGSSTLLSNALAEAARIGVLMVAAAGNNGRESISFPGKDKSTVCVGANDVKGKRAWFSNFGPEIDLIAPGVGIVSTHLGQDIRTLSGTSMATPHVAGCFAIAASVFPKANAEQLINHFRSYSDGKGDWNKEYGYGAPKMINILSNKITDEPDDEPEEPPVDEPDEPDPGPKVTYTFTLPKTYSMSWRTMSDGEMKNLRFTVKVEISSRNGLVPASITATSLSDSFFRNRFLMMYDEATELDVAKWTKVFYKMNVERAGYKADITVMILDLNGVNYKYDKPTSRKTQRHATRENVITGSW